MAKEYTVYELNENDYLPFGTHAEDGIEFPSMEIDGMRYLGQFLLPSDGYGVVARWITPDNLKEERDYDAAQQTLNKVAETIGGGSQGWIECNYSIENFHQVAFEIGESTYENMTVGELKALGIFDALDKAVEFLAYDANRIVTEEDFQNLH